MFGLSVEATLTPPFAGLLAWGRAPDGQWWALLTWAVEVRSEHTHHRVICSAWCPSRTVSPTPYSRNTDYQAVLRLHLPPDPQHWPSPWIIAGNDTHHYGALTEPAGDAPPGYERFSDGHGHHPSVRP